MAEILVLPSTATNGVSLLFVSVENEEDRRRRIAVFTTVFRVEPCRTIASSSVDSVDRKHSAGSRYGRR